jgi:hypothetical protein
MDAIFEWMNLLSSSHQTDHSLPPSLSLTRNPLPFDFELFRHASDILDQIESKTKEKFPTSQHMLTGKDQGMFLSLLCGFIEAKSVLDMGMFTGYSALAFALGVSRIVSDFIFLPSASSVNFIVEVDPETVIHV